MWSFFVDCHPFCGTYLASTSRVLPLVLMTAVERIPAFREADATGIRPPA